jgi:hypothetical protein
MDYRRRAIRNYNRYRYEGYLDLCGGIFWEWINLICCRRKEKEDELV